MQSLVILGRQPALGLAELESLYGAASLRPIGDAATPRAALLEHNTFDVSFDRLGGAIKLCQVVTVLATTDWAAIEDWLVKTCPAHIDKLDSGKIQIGLSVYGLSVSVPRLGATGLSLKKAIRSSGRGVRFIQNSDLALTSAQVIHNHLTGPTGWEFVLVHDGGSTIVGLTAAVQDITSYTIRDRHRPRRDARVGMLPPKLAQIIINLARPTPHGVVLDPFCGTGVLLQEALLMGFSVYGSDLEPRMIDYSRENLEWLKHREPWLAKNIDEHGSTHIFLEVQDATIFQDHDVISSVASETYLGRPFTTPPSPAVLADTIAGCNLIVKKFLHTIAPQLPPGARLCLAMPAWQLRPGQFTHLPLLQDVPALGYQRIEFEHVPAGSDQLIYYREGQFVGRELVVLTKSS